MKIIRSIKGMQRIVQELKRSNKSIGFVPTMGALHKGHLSLVRQARKENDIVVVSIFVNPTQFDPKEDFKHYPRPIRQDVFLCRKTDVDFVFYPQDKDMYPSGFKTYVTVEELSNVLCGAFRPGHFRGVATVVTKLFNITQPDIAYFGQKDAQQAIIIERMAKDLNMPIKIKIMPIMREKDNLAMSSRNIYLNNEERRDALVLSQALNMAKGLIKSGLRDSKKIIKKMRQLIKIKKTAKIDYISIVDLENLKPMDKVKDSYLIALAVWIGKTRLIDNTIISQGRFLR